MDTRAPWILPARGGAGSLYVGFWEKKLALQLVLPMALSSVGLWPGAFPSYGKRARRGEVMVCWWQGQELAPAFWKSPYIPFSKPP